VHFHDGLPGYRSFLREWPHFFRSSEVSDLKHIALLINHRPISREEATFFSLFPSIAIVVADAAHNVNNFNRSARTRRLASRLSATEYEALIIPSSRDEPARWQRTRQIIPSMWRRTLRERFASACDNCKDFNIDAIASLRIFRREIDYGEILLLA